MDIILKRSKSKENTKRKSALLREKIVILERMLYNKNSNVNRKGKSMRGILKKALALILAAVLTFGTAATVMAAAPSPTQGKVPADQAKADTDDSMFVVKTTKKGTATVIGVKKTNKKTRKVPASVKVNGINYKVTAIGTKSLKSWSKVTKVTLSENVLRIRNSAFKNCKQLKKIVIKNKKATKIDKKAFKGINTKKVTIQFSKKMSAKTFKTMKSRLKKAGFKGKIKK